MCLDESDGYYVKHRDRFDPFIVQIETCLAVRLGEIFAEEEVPVIMREVLEDYEKLLPRLPYIGDDNPLAFNLVGATYGVCLYGRLEERGLELREISLINQKVLLDWSRQTMTPERVEYMRHVALAPDTVAKGAERSRKRVYAGDWVYECVLPERNEDFDIGITYTKCGVADFLEKIGKKRYLPYICLNDYPIYGAMGIFFKREHTIGNGDDCCDFRFKLNETGNVLDPICDPAILLKFRENDPGDR